MEKKLQILLVEDSIDDAALIEHLLKKEGLSFSSRTVETKKDFEEELLRFKPDVVISDHSLPQFNSMEALEIFRHYKKEHNQSAAFILVTGTVSEEFAVNAIQSGADDYILKDRLKRLPSAIVNAVEKNISKEENKKREEERHYLLDILQKSLHEIYVFDPETLLFEYANEEALQNLGYTIEELTTMTPADMIYDFDKTRYSKMYAEVEKSSKGMIYERYALRKDDSKYPVQIHMQVIQQGQNKKVLANLLDITEAKEHEQQKELALFIQNCFNENRSLEESLRLVLKELCKRSGLPAAEVWAKDFAGTEVRRYAVWNEQDKCPEKTGKSLAEMAYKTGNSEKYVNLQDEKFKNNALLKKSPYVSAMAYPIKSGNDITAVIVIYTQEISKERDAFINLKEGVQDKLAGNIKRKKTEEELQKVFDLSPDVLAIIGKDGYVRRINPSFQRILGHTEEEMLSRSFEDLIHPEDKILLEQWKEDPLDEKEVAHYESRWLGTNGKYRCFSWSVTRFLNEELQFAVGKDITDHKEQVKSIQEQNEKLADIAWEQSHVVRAPLTRLLACISYLEENEDNQEEILASVKASAHELDEIIKTIVNKTEHITQDAEY